MKPTTQKFFAELKKAKGKTNLKANKVQLGAIDDIHSKFDSLRWDDGLGETYDKFLSAANFGEALINETQAELDGLLENLNFLEGALSELGVDYDNLTADAWQQYNRISVQVEGLRDDMNSGVLSGI